VAVISRQPGVDPIGAVVGVRGARIQNIVNELSGERIDVIRWDPNELAYIANALSPAEVVSIYIDDATNTAFIAVPDKQLSLAIGKEGQNARLAAKLTKLRIDIRGEGSLIEAGEDLHPPPEPNLDPIPLTEHAAIPKRSAAELPDGVTPSQAVPVQTDEQALGETAAVQEVRLTPEQEILAEFSEKEPAAVVETRPIEEERIVALPSEREDPSVLRFADEVRELRLAEEEEQERERERRRGRRRGGTGATPARPGRRGRQEIEYDEDEIEAALHGENYLDEDFEEFNDTSSETSNTEDNE
jgi:N utilization substance protein A